MPETEQNNDGYQIIVVNITYGREINSKTKDRPNMTVLDVPESILKYIGDKEKFESNIETFAYNTITRKYGAEVEYCQIFLP